MTMEYSPVFPGSRLHNTAASQQDLRATLQVITATCRHRKRLKWATKRTAQQQCTPAWWLIVFGLWRHAAKRKKYQQGRCRQVSNDDWMVQKEPFEDLTRIWLIRIIFIIINKWLSSTFQDSQYPSPCCAQAVWWRTPLVRLLCWSTWQRKEILLSGTGDKRRIQIGSGQCAEARLRPGAAAVQTLTPSQYSLRRTQTSPKVQGR